VEPECSETDPNSPESTTKLHGSSEFCRDSQSQPSRVLKK
jgi:hypothetical protein